MGPWVSGQNDRFMVGEEDESPRGDRHAGDLGRSGAALPPELAAHRPPTFVGRREAIDTLLAAHEAAATDPWPQVVEVVGVGGVGKSALIATAAEPMAAAGAPVRYASWSRTPFATLEPLWRAGLVPTPVADRPASAALSHRQLAEQVLAELAGVGGSAPLVVVFDDLHWLPAGFELALSTVVARHEGGALFVLAHRPQPQGSLLESVIPKGARRIWLDPFTPTELDELLGTDRGGAVPARPWLAAALLTPERPGRFDRLAVELSGHPEDTRRLVELLAFHPEGLTLEVLERGVGGSAPVVLERVRRLIADGLAVEIRATPARFALVHELVARRVQEEMVPARRSELHAVLHGLLLAADAPPTARVHHALGAVDLIGSAAHETIVAAARSLVTAGVHADAISLAEEVRRRGLVLPLADRCAIEAVELYARSGLGEQVAASSRLLELAVEAAAAHEWAAMALVIEYRQLLGRPEATDEREMALLRVALAEVGADQPRLRFSLLSATLYDAMHGGRPPDEVMATPDEMLVLADRLGDPHRRAVALAAQHWCLSATAGTQQDLDGRSAALLDLASTTDDPGIWSRAHGAAIGSALHRHDLVAVRRHVEALMDDPDPLGRWQAVLARIALLIDEGDLERAERAIRSAEEQAARRGVRHQQAGPTSQRFVIAWTHGKLARWRPQLEAVDRDAPGRAVWGAVLAAARLQDGDPEGAAEAGRGAAERVLAADDWFGRFVGAVLGEVAHFTADRILAELDLAILDRWAGRRVFVGAATIDLGPVDHYLSLAHGVLGSTERAAELRARAWADAACPLWRQRVERTDTGLVVAPDGTPWAWIG